MNDVKENRGPEIVSLMITFLVVTWISVTVRFYTRLWVRNVIGADDWLIIVAIVSPKSIPRIAAISLFTKRMLNLTTGQLLSIWGICLCRGVSRSW